MTRYHVTQAAWKLVDLFAYMLLGFFLVLVMSGCVLTLERQQAADLVFESAKQGAESVGLVAQHTKELVVELQAEEPDESAVNYHVTHIGNGLQSASESLNEIGKTADVMQEDFGAPEPSQKVEAGTQADGMRTRYRAKAKAFNVAKSVISAKTGIPLPGGKSSSPWSPTEIVGLISAIAVAATAAGKGGSHVLKTSRAARDGTKAIAQMKQHVPPEQFVAIMKDAPGAVVLHREEKLDTARRM